MNFERTRQSFKTTVKKGATVKDAVDAYLQVSRSKKLKSIKELERIVSEYVEPFLDMKLANVQAHHVQTWHQEIGLTAPTQANRALSVFSGVFTTAMHHGWIQYNPCAAVSPFPEHRRQREITPTEARRIAERLRHYDKTVHAEGALFLWIMIYSGARPSEIANIRWRDVTMKDGFAHITLQTHKTDKTVKQRNIVLPPQVVRYFPTVVHPDKRIAGSRQPRYLWEKIRTEIGSPDIRMYDLRHWFASVVVASGHSVSDVSVLFQHTNPSTSLRYVHGLETKVRNLVTDASDYLDAMMGETR